MTRNAIFAPAFRPQNFDDVFVYGFYSWNEQVNSLEPMGMTFQNRADLNGETVGTPNSVIERMTIDHLFDQFGPEYYSSLAEIIWSKNSKTNPKEFEENDIIYTIWTYTIPGFLLPGMFDPGASSLEVPNDLTFDYDVAKNNDEENAAKEIIVSWIESIIPRLRYISVEEADFNANNLLNTYCRNKTSAQLNFDQTDENFDIDNFFDCGLILPFEEVYALTTLLTLTTFSKKTLFSMVKELITEDQSPIVLDVLDGLYIVVAAGSLSARASKIKKVLH